MSPNIRTQASQRWDKSLYYKSIRGLNGPRGAPASRFHFQQAGRAPSEIIESPKCALIYFPVSVSILEKGPKRRVRERTLQPVQELGQISLLLQRAASQPHQVTTRRTAPHTRWRDDVSGLE